MFDMKDLGIAKHNLGMEIMRDKKTSKLWLSQERYIERMLERFNMKYSKSVSAPLVGYFKLSKKSCSSTEEEMVEMSFIPYSLIECNGVYTSRYILGSWSHEQILSKL